MAKGIIYTRDLEMMLEWLGEAKVVRADIDVLGRTYSLIIDKADALETLKQMVESKEESNGFEIGWNPKTKEFDFNPEGA